MGRSSQLHVRSCDSRTGICHIDKASASWLMESKKTRISLRTGIRKMPWHERAWACRFSVIIVMTRHIQSECRTTAMSISGVSLLIISVLNAHLLWIILWPLIITRTVRCGCPQVSRRQKRCPITALGYCPFYKWHIYAILNSICQGKLFS